MISKAHVMALATGDSWLEKGATALLFGPHGAVSRFLIGAKAVLRQL